MNKFLSGFVLGIKVIISFFLIGCIFIAYYVPSRLPADIINRGNSIFIFILLGFLVLPTLFVFWVKNSLVKRFPAFARAWKFSRIIYAIMLILFLAFMIKGIFMLKDYQKTQQAVEFINSKKIVLYDVFGNNLPPKPDQAQNDSTVAGIDANHNFIRDDVELAIFAKYLNSARIRAAELQYAQALQLELTQVFNSETLVATLKKESLGYDCVGQTGPKVSLKNTHEEIISAEKISDDRLREVENLTLNTATRQKKEKEDTRYMTSYSLPTDNQECDIDPLSLPN